MAQAVAPSDLPLESPRWGIPFYEVPTHLPNCTYQSGKPGSMTGEYGRVLDTVYEMADQVATANGVRIEDAIDGAIRSNGWSVLPKHRRLLATIWKQDETKPIRLEAMINRKHLYSIGTRRGERRFNIEVVAGNRRAAVTIAHQNGFRAYDVNMVG